MKINSLNDYNKKKERDIFSYVLAAVGLAFIIAIIFKGFFSIGSKLILLVKNHYYIGAIILLVVVIIFWKWRKRKKKFHEK